MMSIDALIAVDQLDALQFSRFVIVRAESTSASQNNGLHSLQQKLGGQVDGDDRALLEGLGWHQSRSQGRVFQARSAVQEKHPPNDPLRCHPNPSSQALSLIPT